MSFQLNSVLLLSIGFITIVLPQIHGAPTLQLTHQIYEDLMTKDFYDLLMEMSLKEKNQSVYDDLERITYFHTRLQVAEKKYPHLYTLMKKYSNKLMEHIENMYIDVENVYYEQTTVFLAKYMVAVIEFIGPEEDFKSDFVRFLKVVIPRWQRMDQEAREIFAEEMPNIAKYLNDKTLQKFVADEKTINIQGLPATTKADQEKRLFWWKLKQVFHGPSQFKS